MTKIFVDAAKTPKAQRYHEEIARLFKIVPIEDAEVMVVLGGDGYMLEALHRTKTANVSVYGIHCGTVGFLMNAVEFDEIHDLSQRIEKAIVTKLHPLRVEIQQKSKERTVVHAINEITLHRQTHQVCKLSIEINGKIRMENLAGDGVIVSTAAGSTAYNFSAGGSIIPLGIPLLSLTALNPFSPRHWKGAIIHNTAKITVRVHDSSIRSVQATADFVSFNDIEEAVISEDQSIILNLLFDSDHNLEERVLNEQFAGEKKHV